MHFRSANSKMRLMLEFVPRFCITPKTQSFFLFGPRGTGKTQFLRQTFPAALYLNLLLPREMARYSANPEQLTSWVMAHIKPGQRVDVVIDEVQKVPSLLSVVHDLLEQPYGKKTRVIMTGSSSRKLRAAGADLLAGRALNLTFHPFMAKELGAHWDLSRALQWGTLPVVWASEDPLAALNSYVGTYLKEEVLQEGLVRNLGNFSRFLEVMSSSQASPVNVSAMAREAQVGQKTAEGYVQLIADLLLGEKLPLFTKKAKRELSAHAKFFYFDCGVFQSLRPSGPLDAPASIAGVGLETLVYQHLRAWIAYGARALSLHFWRTRSGVEVDFVIYGKEEFAAIEVKASRRIRSEDLGGLRAFGTDYPGARLLLLYGGEKKEIIDNIICLPVGQFLKDLDPAHALIEPED